MIRSLSWPVILIVSALFASLTLATNLAGFLQPWFIFWFLLVCPGMAFIRLFHIKDPLSEWVLAIALSLALDTILAEIMVLTRHWSPAGGLVLLISLSLAGALLQIKGIIGAIIGARQTL
jgi:hypothetical protein